MTDSKSISEKISDSIDKLEEKCKDLTGTEKSDCEELINAHITELIKINADVPQALEKSLEDLNDANKDTTINLADKKTTVKIMNEKSNNLRNHIENIKQERLNKKRVVEASEWEYDRYNSHIYIFKFIFFSLVLVNIILFLRNKLNFIPDMISFGLIIFIIAVMIYNVGTEMILNTRRDKFDYDKFKQPTGDEYNINDGTLGVTPESVSGNIFNNLFCESFVNNNKKDTLNRHTYSFI
jgi:hypothetical protein